MPTAELGAEAFFDLAAWEHGALFAPEEPVWSALAGLTGYLAQRTAGAGAPSAPDGVWLRGDVIVGPGVVFVPGAYVQGPAVIEAGAVLRQGCYLRGDVLVGAGAVVGHCSELKHSVLLPGAKAPHFNYVGDSLVGRGVNLGAGTILSNVPLAGRSVFVSVGGQRVDSGLRKFGAVLGDGCETGCNVVLNPGTVAGPGCRFYPGASAVGYFPPRAVVKAPVARPATEKGGER
jgi:NDP-sugar pyrophosphorylase family protein